MNNKLNLSRVAVVVVVIVCVYVLAALAKNVGYPMYARYKWKEKAIPEIVHLVDDKDWISREVAYLNGADSGHAQHIIAEGWLSDNMILMKSGEWLVYRSHCSKVEPHNVEDIFLAKGSNGMWYYSTCHFCVGMCALLMHQEIQPNDLAIFVRCYGLSEFDGKSNQCLRKTRRFPDYDAINATEQSAPEATPTRPKEK